MCYNKEMEIIESIDRKEIFDNLELDIMEDIDILPIGSGFIVYDSILELVEAETTYDY